MATETVRKGILKYLAKSRTVSRSQANFQHGLAQQRNQRNLQTQGRPESNLMPDQEQIRYMEIWGPTNGLPSS